MRRNWPTRPGDDPTGATSYRVVKKFRGEPFVSGGNGVTETQVIQGVLFDRRGERVPYVIEVRQPDVDTVAMASG
jgi:hypothetical protein